MAEESLKRKAVNAVLWRIGGVGGTQLIQLVISVVLARLISPEQFGLLAELTVFIALAGVFIDSGFSTALVRKNNRTYTDCCTVYWFNIVVSIVCYLIIFFCAPLVAIFYDQPELTSILRVTAISIVIGSFAGVHRTLLIAEMNFKAMTKFNLTGLIISAVVGIVMAFKGFQVWALVAQNLTGCVLSTIFVWYKVKWRPSLLFAKESFKEFFGFGSKLLVSSLLDTAYNNLYSIIIGKVFKPADLAFYGRANSLTNMTSSMPTNILQSVTYPTLCKMQDDENALRKGYRRIIKVSCFVVFPLCLGIGAVAYPLINVLYTERWIYSAVLLSIIVFGMMWYPMHAINLNYLQVKGRSDLFLRLEILKKIIGVIVLCITVPFGLEAMCWGSVVFSLICLFCNTYFTGKLLKMGIISQLKDIWSSLILSLVMFAGARGVAMYFGNGILSLACSILTGILIYLGGAKLFRFVELKELINIRK